MDSYRGVRVSRWIAVSRRIATQGNHASNPLAVHQVLASDSGLSSNVNLGTKRVVDLNQVSDGPGVSQTVPLVVHVVDSVLINEIIPFDVIGEVRIKLLVDVEDFVVPAGVVLRSWCSWVLGRRDGIILG